MAVTIRSITCRELNELCQSGDQIELIDVRTPVEFREVHSSHARNVPLESLNPNTVMQSRVRPDAPLYVICRSGNRSSKACEAFQAAGFANVISVEGGTAAWDQAGYCVNRGKKAVSLERQVRIVAGLMVLTGVILSQVAHEYWIGLSGFVGAGLVFAGITDSCPMAMLIAKMPWNQVKSPCNSSTGASTNASTPSGGACCGS